MKVYKEDGTFYYYYYSKKKGRKKKRGPKKKKKKGQSVYDGSWNYKIILFKDRKQVEYIGKYRTYADASAEKSRLMEQNDKVVFPVKYMNRNGRITEFMYEYAILKKIKDDEETNESMLRNQYGKYVKHVATSKDYYIYEKFPMLMEESFWVYGHNPRTDRKTYSWISENLIRNFIGTAEDVLNIYVYHNKLIIRYGYNDINFVICKNTDDAIRMYNMLEEEFKPSRKNQKVLPIIFTGMVSGYTERGKETIKILSDKTGWSERKIYASTTCK